MSAATEARIEREDADRAERDREEYGYTYRCRGCGQWCDTSWCGCPEGAEDDERDEDEPTSEAAETEDAECPF